MEGTHRAVQNHPMTTGPSVEILIALIAFYTLGFLWFILPEPEFAELEQEEAPTSRRP